jgi:uncharacterized Zn-finger protein
MAIWARISFLGLSKRKINRFDLTEMLARIQSCRYHLIFHAQMPIMDTPCKHPRVRVVAREEDAEYVECQECGEVFDSNEFRDMAIEETQADEEEI